MIKKTQIQSGVSTTGFTLVELLIAVAIIFILLGMFLPATRRGRPISHRIICSNQLRQLALANLNFESAHMHFPAATGDPMMTKLSSAADADRLSGLILLMPYMEQDAVYRQISEGMEYNGVAYPPFPSPNDTQYPIWQTAIRDFQCTAAMSDDDGFAELNYAFCIGDAARNIHDPKFARGATAAKMNLTLADMSDGTSNSIFMSEMGSLQPRKLVSQIAIYQPGKMLDNPGLALRLANSRDRSQYPDSTQLATAGRGSNWADGSAGCAMFNTILPPNSPSVSFAANKPGDGFYSAGSFHRGGVNMARVDGSVTFIRETIDCGDLKQPPLDLGDIAMADAESPYGVWGALGSVNGGEVVTNAEY